MKTVKKKIELTLEQAIVEDSSCSILSQQKFTYVFSSRNYIQNPETLEHFIEVEEAETLKEFRKLKGVSKETIVKFLNSNF